MLDCDRFEEHYEAWKAGRLPDDQSEAMQRHATECRYCRLKGRETARLRSLLGSLQRLEPSPDFDYRLRRRIAQLEERSHPIAGRRAAPFLRWKVIGAGVVTGLVIGLFLFYPVNPPVENAGDSTGGEAETGGGEPRIPVIGGFDRRSAPQVGFESGRIEVRGYPRRRPGVLGEEVIPGRRGGASHALPGGGETVLRMAVPSRGDSSRSHPDSADSRGRGGDADRRIPAAARHR